MTEPILTIGHSNRPLDEFLGLLDEHGIARIVDVRRLPGSARYPWFDHDALAASLDEVGIGYRREEALTGRRGRSHDVPPEINAWWENQSFHNYADHALGEDFSRSLTELVEQTGAQRVAVMCSEAVWWRCHRRIIADHLLARGRRVRHVIGAGHADAAELSDGARVGQDGTVTYPEVTHD